MKASLRKSTPRLWPNRLNLLTLLGVGLMLSCSGSKMETTASSPPATYVSAVSVPGAFPLSSSSHSTALLISDQDYPGVLRVSGHLQADLERVTKRKTNIIYSTEIPHPENVVIVGTLGKSPIIDQLVHNKKIDLSAIAGKWETFVIQTIDNPFPEVKKALVIAGSDKRGTIYGMYDLAEKMGVSPWYWWADVPVVQHDELFVLPGKYSAGTPKVKYRGIFINDEAPALANWATDNYGGFNHQFYDKVFELILRMKGNYLWPAMWGRAIYDDDPESPKLADEYGIVIGTSHHEPLMRAHVEWSRYGEGPWNYNTNEAKLKAFWTEGVERMGTNESIVTIGMRGDGDEPMSEESNIALLERIVADQRQIIKNVTGKPLPEIPQIWALYKEVQDYYDKGMRVPDDVTLLLCDDNWGNIRKLPKPDAPPRAGGYGIYYHFDYVGGPRNYKWLNTNPLPRIWEQMHLAYEHQADRIWIVNVGDIKPMELPTQFFLNYAWDPDRWPADQLDDYTRQWAAQQFGEKYAAEIADLLAKYAKYNSRRKPELLNLETYSLIHFREAESIVEAYNQLAGEAEALAQKIPAAYHDAYYQLVLYPVKACANLNDLYVTAQRNQRYAAQRRAATNDLSDRVKMLFEKDRELADYYHTKVAGGKWNHMMSQTHIGYTYWQQPEKNTLPELAEIALPAEAKMGVAVEGAAGWWPDENAAAKLPVFDKYNQQNFYLEIFNQGTKPYSFSIKTDQPWLQFSASNGTVQKEERIMVSVNWEKLPGGSSQGEFTVLGTDNQEVVVSCEAFNPEFPKREALDGFVEANGYVSMEAAHFSKAVGSGKIHWEVIPDLGKTLSGVTTFPSTKAVEKAGGEGPHLEYQMYLFSSGPVKVKAYVSPSINFYNDQGLRYAVSFDDGPPQVVNIHEDNSPGAWNKSVAENIRVLSSAHTIAQSGQHTLKFWMLDPGVVLQKLVVETGAEKTTYLGPPESFYKKQE